MMGCFRAVMGLVVLVVGLGMSSKAQGEVSREVLEKISGIYEGSSFLGVVVPNSFEMNPLLQSSSFVAHPSLPYLDFSGRRFRIGRIQNQNVIIVMTGLGMLNTGIATQLLLTLFKVEGVVHYGIAGNANPELEIGDVTIPQYWAHTGLWNWQRYGDGPDDELALESNGDYTRTIGYLNISNYTTGPQQTPNLLNNIWYQPEETFPVTGTPELRQHAFWVPVDKHYFTLSKKLEAMTLNGCVNTTCLPRTPIVTRVERGVSADVFVDNGAYREFLFSEFGAAPIDMESAAVALVCAQQETPFIAFRALSDLAGGGSADEAATFGSLAAQNAVDVLLGFVTLLSS